MDSSNIERKKNVKLIVLGAASQSMAGGWGCAHIKNRQCKYRNEQGQWCDLFEIKDVKDDEIKYYPCSIVCDAIKIALPSGTSGYVALSVFQIFDFF